MHLLFQMGRTKSATYRNNAQNRLFSAKPIVMDWRKIKMKLCCRTTVPNVFLVQSYVMESQIVSDVIVQLSKLHMQESSKVSQILWKATDISNKRSLET